MLDYHGPLDPSIIFQTKIRSKAENSIKNYKSGFRKWREFAVENKLTIFPINKIEFEIFLIESVHGGLSWASISVVKHSANYFLSLFSFEKLDCYR